MFYIYIHIYYIYKYIYIYINFFKLATTLKDIMYLMKQVLRLFFENLSSKTLPLEAVNLPKNEINF